MRNIVVGPDSLPGDGREIPCVDLSTCNIIASDDGSKDQLPEVEVRAL